MLLLLDDEGMGAGFTLKIIKISLIDFEAEVKLQVISQSEAGVN